jgi:hypothetical protein
MKVVFQLAELAHFPKSHAIALPSPQGNRIYPMMMDYDFMIAKMISGRAL